MEVVRNVTILVVGSVALDTVETPFARVEETLGGAASYFSTAATLDTQLGVYAGFHAVIPTEYRSSPLLFLANIQPELQLEVLEQVPQARLTVLDTMELWIMTERPQLTEVIKRVDMLLMSEEEVRQYTNRPSLLAGVRQLFAMGLKYVVVKQGSYGAVLFGADGTYFSAPSYPLEEVVDPTGAGDAFAGGLLGYLSTVEAGEDGSYSIDNIKRGVVHGQIIGSYACEDFSIGRLRTLTMDDVATRYNTLVECSHFDPEWRPVHAI